jgi:hypothetical protein
MELRSSMEEGPFNSSCQLFPLLAHISNKLNKRKIDNKGNLQDKEGHEMVITRMMKPTEDICTINIVFECLGDNTSLRQIGKYWRNRSVHAGGKN